MLIEDDDSLEYIENIHNKDLSKRDEILQLTEKDWVDAHGSISLEVNLEILQKLFHEDFILYTDEYQWMLKANDVLEFIQKYPHFRAEIIVAVDGNTWIEGLLSDEIIKDFQQLKDFILLAKDADEFEIEEYTRAWWD